MIAVNGVEALWFALGLTTTILTVIALLNALENRREVIKLAVPAHVIAADGIVRREWLRLYKQAVLLGIAVPGLFTDRETPLNWIVIGLMSLQVTLLVQSVWDWWDNRRMTALGTEAVLLVTNENFARLESQIRETTKLVVEGKNVAAKAYDAANHTKERFDVVTDAIAAQGLIQAAQGDELAAQRAETAAASADLAAVADTTASEVHDLHEGTAPAAPEKAPS